MLNYKLIPIIFIVSFFCSCATKTIPFGTSNFKDHSFFQAMPEILGKQIKIDSYTLYETQFTQKPYEGYYVIDYSEVNIANDNNILHYKPFKGFYQKLFLLKLTTQPKDSIVIYFSLKYDKFDNCIGFGPAYIGYIDEKMKYILFYGELYTKRKKAVYWLKKSKLSLQLYMTADEVVLNSHINIEKIIVEQSVEIGNNIVIDIPQIFHDPKALRFNYSNSFKIE